MKISLNWIKDYIDIPKSITSEKLAELLTLHSVEVEGIEKQGEFLDGVILEIDNKTITHRPDLWGHYGIAREIAAIQKLKVKSSKLKVKIHNTQHIAHNIGNLQVEIKDYNLCRRYIGVVIDNIKICPSPKWLQNRLNSVGVRSINNVVDITNYIMLDTGQPLHAFDYDKLFGKNQKDGVKIIVRKAKAGEKITTLDGAERKLDSEMLVIADEEKPIALAGVMGCEISEVDTNTKKIVIEIANFEPINIRQTSAKIGLRTESAVRYEKSLDPNLPQTALDKVLNLINKIIPEATEASKVVDQKKFKLNNVPIKLSLNYVQKKIGVKINSNEVVRILKSLGFEVAPLTSGDAENPLSPPLRKGGILKTPPTPLAKEGDKDIVFNIKVPSWRATKDVSIPDDLVEEVARIYGFDNIFAVAPLVRMRAPKINKERQFERYLKNVLNGLGFDEVYNYALIGEKQIRQIGGNPDEYIKLINSLSIDFAFLRQSLMGNLMNNIKDNLRYFNAFKIFEVGLVFNRRAGKYLAHPDKKDMLPEQKKMIAAVAVDTAKKAEEIFSQTKEAAENLLSKLSITNYQILPSPNSKNIEADIIIGNEKAGSIILIDKNIQNNFDINSKISCGYFEIESDKLFSFLQDDLKYQPLAKFPETKIDLAVVASKGVLWHNIREEIKKTAGAQLKKIELFDVYQGEHIAVGKKSFAMHLNFGEDERTMEMDEVEKLRGKIVKSLKERLDIDIRS